MFLGPKFPNLRLQLPPHTQTSEWQEQSPTRQTHQPAAAATTAYRQPPHSTPGPTGIAVSQEGTLTNSAGTSYANHPTHITPAQPVSSGKAGKQDPTFVALEPSPGVAFQPKTPVTPTAAPYVTICACSPVRQQSAGPVQDQTFPEESFPSPLTPLSLKKQKALVSVVSPSPLTRIVHIRTTYIQMQPIVEHITAVVTSTSSNLPPEGVNRTDSRKQVAPVPIVEMGVSDNNVSGKGKGVQTPSKLLITNTVANRLRNIASKSPSLKQMSRSPSVESDKAQTASETGKSSKCSNINVSPTVSSHPDGSVDSIDISNNSKEAKPATPTQTLSQGMSQRPSSSPSLQLSSQLKLNESARSALKKLAVQSPSLKKELGAALVASVSSTCEQSGRAKCALAEDSSTHQSLSQLDRKVLENSEDLDFELDDEDPKKTVDGGIFRDKQKETKPKEGAEDCSLEEALKDSENFWGCDRDEITGQMAEMGVKDRSEDAVQDSAVGVESEQTGVLHSNVGKAELLGVSEMVTDENKSVGDSDHAEDIALEPTSSEPDVQIEIDTGDNAMETTPCEEDVQAGQPKSIEANKEGLVLVSKVAIETADTAQIVLPKVEDSQKVKVKPELVKTERDVLHSKEDTIYGLNVKAEHDAAADVGSDGAGEKVDEELDIFSQNSFLGRF